MKLFLFMSIFMLLLVDQHLCVIVTGGEPLTVTINGEKTVLTIAEVAASAKGDQLTINDIPYRLNSTWSFFGLHGAVNYTIEHYAVQTNCGCYTQVCGGQCQQGIECHNTVVDDPPYFCMSWTTRRGFCISSVKVGTLNSYSSYYLSHVATIALTEFGGPDVKKEDVKHAGFTIKDQYQQNYSYNAMITEKVPQTQVDLNLYRYVESEGRIILQDDMKYLTDPPILNYDFNGAQCLDNGTAVIQHNLVDQSLNVHGDRTVFRSFVLLREAKEEKLESLTNKYILSLDGVHAWDNQPYFDILDPCNQQFLRMRKDTTTGQYTVEIPAHQRLTEDDIICIAINDVPNTQYDLVLYEMKNGGTFWTPSKRFVGVLSPDYLQNFKLRITTASSVEFSVSDAKIDVDINTDMDPLILRVKTSTAIRCNIHLSKNCSYDLTTTKDQLYATAIIKDCGWFYEIAAYNCEGVFGTFNPPSKYVNAPINDFVENTTIHDVVINSGDVVNIPDNNRGLFSTIAHWFVDWSPSNFLDKLLSIAILCAILVASFYVCIFCTEGKIGSTMLGSIPGLGGVLGGAMGGMVNQGMAQSGQILQGVGLQMSRGGQYQEETRHLNRSNKSGAKINVQDDEEEDAY